MSDFIVTGEVHELENENLGCKIWIGTNAEEKRSLIMYTRIGQAPFKLIIGGLPTTLQAHAIFNKMIITPDLNDGGLRFELEAIIQYL